MAFDFTKTAVEKLGILIRDKARLSNGRYEFSEDQANAILELRLYQLTGLEIDKIRSEYKELVKKIKDLLDILAKEKSFYFSYNLFVFSFRIVLLYNPFL